MSVHKKLMQARLELQKRDLKKSGNNKFAGYKYFELGDFLPAVQEIFAGLGLCGIVTFGIEMATLAIIDTDENGQAIYINSPMSTAALKGCHEVQNLGAVQTYLRRYLWVAAMEIVEHDALDSSEPLKPAPTKDEALAYLKKNFPKEEKKIVEGNGGQWNIKIVEQADGGDWPKAAYDGACMALELAQTAEDVLQIFKTNRTIFEKLKETDPTKHAELMDLFKKTKEAM